MNIIIEPKDILDAYSTPIVQQTSFWSDVKERLGLHSRTFEFKVWNRDLYDGVGGYSTTNADLILFYQYVNREDYIAYVPYGPEIEPSESNQGTFLEELSEGLREYLPRHCIALRYDLNWESHWCKGWTMMSMGSCSLPIMTRCLWRPCSWCFRPIGPLIFMEPLLHRTGM